MTRSSQRSRPSSRRDEGKPVAMSFDQVGCVDRCHSRRLPPCRRHSTATQRRGSRLHRPHRRPWSRGAPCIRYRRDDVRPARRARARGGTSDTLRHWRDDPDSPCEPRLQPLIPFVWASSCGDRLGMHEKQDVHFGRTSCLGRSLVRARCSGCFACSKQVEAVGLVPHP